MIVLSLNLVALVAVAATVTAMICWQRAHAPATPQPAAQARPVPAPTPDRLSTHR